MIMIIVAVVIVFILLWVISTYNKFVKLQNKVEKAFSTMDVYLKKRYDLIPNLVETIKGYIKHESETLKKVISARNLVVNAQSLDKKIKFERNFQSILGPLYAISEQYPNLKADQHFTQLQNELQDIESEIADSRKYYNAVCVRFNNLVEVFPSNLLADMFHETKKPLYETEDAAQHESVKIQFQRGSTAIPFYPLGNKAVSGRIVCAATEGRCVTVS